MRIVSHDRKFMNWHEKITLALFCVFVFSLPFSESLISLSSGLIVLMQLISLFFRKNEIRTLLCDKSAWLISSIIVVYLVGLFFTNDMIMGRYELRKVMFWPTLALGIALAPKLSEKKFWFVFHIFIVSVTASTFFSFARMLMISSYTVENFRDVNYVSHIPFSFQITLCLIILLYSFLYKIPFWSKVNKFLRIFLMIWLAVFLVMLKSMVGLVAFYIMAFALFIYLFKNENLRKFRFGIITMAAITFIVPVVYVGSVLVKFYTIKDKKEETIGAITSLGNKYRFDEHNLMKENGHYVGWYLCESEMKNAWNKRSSLKYNQKGKSGYCVAETLKRYLTSKGLRKDADGVARLTETDIQNIQEGMANYIYDTPVYAIYPRIYETIWELDQYFHTGNPNNRSLAQRIEYAKASIDIIKNNFWFGIGTGNYEIEFGKAFKRIHSKLNADNYGSAHDQYLSYFLKFGLIGFLYIFGVLFLVIQFKRQYKNQLFMLFFIQMMIANLGDSNWETHVGLAYFVFFFALFLWHSPNQIQTAPEPGSH